jgi:Protein of unknown function (DUF1572)
MSSSEQGHFLQSSLKIFRDYKALGEKAIAQLSDEEVLHKPNAESNSIALIVHHLSGNMISRFTDFLTSDGEKPWRNRDREFEEAYPDKAAMMAAWDRGWACVFAALEPLKESDLTTIVYIRKRRADGVGGHPAAVGALCFACGANRLPGKDSEAWRV